MSDISKITLPEGTSYDIKDAKARDEIAAIKGSTESLKALAFKDTATGNFTPSGSVSAPTFKGTPGEVSVTGIPSGTVTIATGTGKANYTPKGVVSAPTTTVKLKTATVNSITNAGTLPSCTFPGFTVDNETLTISAGIFNAGTLPTKGGNVTVATSVESATTTAPTFTGTGVELTAAFTGTETALTGEFTPEGTVSEPEFTGTVGVVDVS